MSVSPADAAFVRELVLRCSAIQLDEEKDYLIEMRLAQLAREQGLADIAALVSRARSGPRDMSVKIIEAMTTHETTFFRDLQPFEIMRLTLLPRLIAARAAQRTLTIWSAGCSSGQEPYSIAMMLLEQFPVLSAWKVSIIGTDLSEQVLARAREATFKQMDMNRGLPARLLTKYFTKVGLHWQLNPEVRRLVEYRQLNLIEPWSFFPKPDIVFLRNVLIYFDVQTKRTILDRVRQTIAKDGVLFLGAAETTLNVAAGWERVATDKHSYYQVQL